MLAESIGSQVRPHVFFDCSRRRFFICLTVILSVTPLTVGERSKPASHPTASYVSDSPIRRRIEARLALSHPGASVAHFL